MDNQAEQSLPAPLQWLARLFKDSLAMRNRWRRTSEERQRLAVLDSTISTVREQLAKVRASGLDHLARVYNVGLYLLLVDRDFSVVGIEMVSTFDGWPLRYTARHAALLLYEVCDDLTQMLGRDFRASLAALEIGEEQQKLFDGLSKRLNRFRREHQSFLNDEVRNVQAAHRAQDALDFLHAVEGLDPIRVFRLAADFFGDVVHPLLGFVTRTLLHAGAPHMLLKQFVGSKTCATRRGGPR